MNGITIGGTAMGGGVDKPKEWQMELLMEKLRSKAAQFKTFTETAKAVRMTLLEKRYPLDSVEKNQHQKCLDTLQHSIKVTSLQSMIERLESLTRQLGLKFMVGPSGVELFISSEMFYLEIVLDPNGLVQDVKVHHEGKVEQQSCIELVNCLSRGDFSDFTAQLEGLSSIYQINAEKKIKCKAFSALQGLETDLSTLAQLQTFIKDPFNILHKSPVGILEKRKGGHAMKLTYFVSPYDLLDKEKATSEPLTVETVTSKNLGYSVTVCMESSTAHKLQTTTIITVNRNHTGKNTPSYAALSTQNSAVIPACFVLKLNQPLPMCVSLVRRIQQVTELDCADLTTTHPLMSLITQHSSNGQLDCANNRGLFVTLPDQHHCYFMTESKSMDGVLVNNIPFTHPCHVPQILGYLRQQALFNSVVSSCIRPCSKQDLESMIMFEVGALSWQHLSISLEHPLEESMATAELDLTDISNVTCKIYTPTSSSMSSAPPGADPTSELASKVFHRCLSIPVTMRAVIKLWDEQANRKNHLNGNENFSLPLGAVDPGGNTGNSGNPLTDFGGLDSKIKREDVGGNHGGGSLAHPHPIFLNDSFAQFPGSDLLNISEIGAMLSSGSSGGSTPGDKSAKRNSKRKASEELWKNPKKKAGEDEDEESSSSSTSMSTPTSHDAVSEMGMATPNSALGFHSDLELSGLDAPEIAEKVVEYECADEERKPERKFDLAENKTLIPPSVSITPISTQQTGFSTVLTNMGLERRPGIEIIPIASSPATSLPSSITITPISSSHKLDERRSDKKSSKTRSDDKSRLEKKRKRKRDEAPMGPPEKLPPKQDPLSKPVSVSIKPAESPPTSPSMLRKFASSPSLSGKSSPSLLKPISKSSSHSPKHSSIVSSPKHSSLSPKNHGSSPKHPSASGTGKPSMSTLKSAANSPSGKTENKIKKDSRDKDKKVFSVSNPKVKSSSVKLKQLDLSTDSQNSFQNDLPSPSGLDLSKTALNQVRNRKGSLSAVIDKLKSAQHCTEGEIPPSGKSARSGSNSGKTMENKTTKVGENKNSEYMVKPSSEGIKITINKTRTKESSNKSSASNMNKSSSGTGSPKTHTGLKPGVNSGPASKKPQQQQQPQNLKSASNYSSSIKTTSKVSSGKNSSGSSLNLSKSVSKLSPKSSGASDLSRKDRPRLNKSASDKSIFSSSAISARRASPTAGRDEIDSERAFKMLAQSSSLMMEGMIKSLDTNFQIPKLSARTNDEKKSNKTHTENNISRVTYDLIAKNDLSLSKYPLALSKPFENNIKNSLLPTPPALPPSLLPDDEKKPKDLSLPVKEDLFPISASKSFPPVEPPLEEKIPPKEELLDFSIKPPIAVPLGPPPAYPASPSVSVHIVKSPAPSPMVNVSVNPSPHSASPCITDDELMDEALVGLGK